MALTEKKICLYCMGSFGIRTFFFLYDRGIPVSYFGDNQKEKRGKSFRGVKCLSYDECIKLPTQDYRIIVCNKNPDSLVKAFSDAGFDARDCKSVWQELKNTPFVNSVEAWSSPDKLKQLYSSIKEIYSNKNAVSFDSSYGSDLLQDFATFGALQ